MGNLNEELQSIMRVNELRIKGLTEAIAHMPEGSIRVAVERGKTRFYHRVGKGKGKYTKDLSLIQTLINKEYAALLRESLQKENNAIRGLIQGPEDITNQLMLPTKRSYIRSATVDKAKSKYIAQWLSQKYTPKPFSLGSPEIFSLSGKRVRSKSEADIIDCLEARGIPFIYELPVLVDGRWYHPDFTCLNKRTLDVVYWEHWGKMDDLGYVNTQLNRVRIYRNKGIILDKNLFVTMESGSFPLTPFTINEFIDNHLV